MKKFHLAAVAFALGAVAAVCQPPDDEPKGPPKKGPPPFKAGKVLPPFVREELGLTRSQERQIEALEKEVRERLLRILTPEQRRKLESFRGRGPGKGGGFDGPPDGKGGPRRKKGRPDGPPHHKGRPEGKGVPGPLDEERALGDTPRGGIQWFATWESGLREARRSGRPILLVSAAPHCAGVSGVW